MIVSTDLIGEVPRSLEKTGGPADWQENADIIRLKPPFLFPTAWHPPHYNPAVVEVVAALEATRRGLNTMLSLGHVRTTDRQIWFEQLRLPGDPFGLAAGECGATQRQKVRRYSSRSQGWTARR
jgi:hypothetical protein